MLGYEIPKYYIINTMWLSVDPGVVDGGLSLWEWDRDLPLLLWHYSLVERMKDLPERRALDHTAMQIHNMLTSLEIRFSHLKGNKQSLKEMLQYIVLEINDGRELCGVNKQSGVWAGILRSRYPRAILYSVYPRPVAKYYGLGRIRRDQKKQVTRQMVLKWYPDLWGITLSADICDSIMNYRYGRERAYSKGHKPISKETNTTIVREAYCYDSSQLLLKLPLKDASDICSDYFESTVGGHELPNELSRTNEADPGKNTE
jgi:hypothetical protein